MSGGSTRTVPDGGWGAKCGMGVAAPPLLYVCFLDMGCGGPLCLWTASGIALAEQFSAPFAALSRAAAVGSRQDKPGLDAAAQSRIALAHRGSSFVRPPGLKQPRRAAELPCLWPQGVGRPRVSPAASVCLLRAARHSTCWLDLTRSGLDLGRERVRMRMAGRGVTTRGSPQRFRWKQPKRRDPVSGAVAHERGASSAPGGGEAPRPPVEAGVCGTSRRRLGWPPVAQGLGRVAQAWGVRARRRRLIGLRRVAEAGRVACLQRTALRAKLGRRW